MGSGRQPGPCGGARRSRVTGRRRGGSLPARGPWRPSSRRSPTSSTRDRSRRREAPPGRARRPAVAGARQGRAAPSRRALVEARRARRPHDRRRARRVRRGAPRGDRLGRPDGQEGRRHARVGAGVRRGDLRAPPPRLAATRRRRRERLKFRARRAPLSSRVPPPTEADANVRWLGLVAVVLVVATGFAAGCGAGVTDSEAKQRCDQLQQSLTCLTPSQYDDCCLVLPAVRRRLPDASDLPHDVRLPGVTSR